MLLGEIPDDGIRFPQYKSVIIDGGYDPVGIQRQVFRLIVTAERATDIRSLERDVQLVA